MVNPYPPQYPPQPPHYSAPQYPYPYPPRPQGNGIALTGMILGILALVLFWIPFVNWLLAVMGIVFGIIGMSLAKKRAGAGKGMAVAGLACGIAAAVLDIVIILLVMRAVHEVKHAIDDIDQRENVRMVANKFADEAYPRWASEHTTSPCPSSLDDLMPYMDAKDRKDPWGHDYQMTCNAEASEGANKIVVYSVGPDGIRDTEDDIKSW